ncbi:hypothetical protein V4C53_13650 [Paraburkholderia azotifigens]|uniref:hypothetical protein n=1 Tax=Paraburkholderia azotifigens TaxID=2057004 RepID=UPI003176E49B
MFEPLNESTFDHIDHSLVTLSDLYKAMLRSRDREKMQSALNVARETLVDANPMNLILDLTQANLGNGYVAYRIGMVAADITHCWHECGAYVRCVLPPMNPFSTLNNQQ